MKGFNGSKPISEETRKKMSESAKRTLNGFKSGHAPTLIKHSEESKQKMREIALISGRRPDFTGRKHTEESKEKMRIASTNNPARYWLGKNRSHVFTEEYRLKMSKALKKVVAEGRHNFWKGGVTELNEKARTSVEYKLWREAVFKRDNYVCQECDSRGNKLNAHHIKSFSKYPDLRYEISNGITLCLECHKKTDNYGRSKLSPTNAPAPLAGITG